MGAQKEESRRDCCTAHQLPTRNQREDTDREREEESSREGGAPQSSCGRPFFLVRTRRRPLRYRHQAPPEGEATSESSGDAGRPGRQAGLYSSFRPLLPEQHSAVTLPDTGKHKPFLELFIPMPIALQMIKRKVWVSLCLAEPATSFLFAFIGRPWCGLCYGLHRG